ncbi:uncharacterized protein LOC108441373 isoform X2 [Pygocentrus nattereri]|uniref:uncharacterized protein LOC108441373 isoform X2 n=1 Tax=Pygocentrus nattereri TaxID=42514 RepID=UPI0008143574|nr:uncharacterized protein LOC108441373 isoform X2 [Pygocentrus nattereri]
MDVRHRKQLSLSLFMCRSHCKTTETMGLQYLISLIFLAQPFLIQSVSQCIKAHPKWNLTEQLNCTITPAEQNNGSEIRGYSRMEKDQSCDNTTTDTLNPGCISSIAINGILLLAMFVVICIKLKRAQNNQNQPPGATQLEELQTLQGGQSNSTQARSDV